MDQPKETFVVGLEKYQHFSTGLMFAVAAAAVQSAKFDTSTRLQTYFELAAWFFLIAAALVGVVSALRLARNLVLIDTAELLAYNYNSSIKDEEESFYWVVKKDGTESNMSRKEYMERTLDDRKVTTDKLIAAFQSIQWWAVVQVLLFSSGLAVLAFARAIPAFTHQSGQSIVVSGK